MEKLTYHKVGNTYKYDREFKVGDRLLVHHKDDDDFGIMTLVQELPTSFLFICDTIPFNEFDEEDRSIEHKKEWFSIANVLDEERVYLITEAEEALIKIIGFDQTMKIFHLNED